MNEDNSDNIIYLSNNAKKNMDNNSNKSKLSKKI